MNSRDRFSNRASRARSQRDRNSTTPVASKRPVVRKISAQISPVEVRSRSVPNHVVCSDNRRGSQSQSQAGSCLAGFRKARSSRTKAEKIRPCKAYGKSSDLSQEDPSHKGLVPDPYLELVKHSYRLMAPPPNCPHWMVVAYERLRARTTTGKDDPNPNKDSQNNNVVVLGNEEPEIGGGDQSDSPLRAAGSDVCDDQHGGGGDGRTATFRATPTRDGSWEGGPAGGEDEEDDEEEEGGVPPGEPSLL
ncbi:uncharacterized protein LOC106013335 [Aplysia californica]|uniref:Uncharacterized protein LOC106013335 n=1 Tax=Aplysia californica TaxID=6500 RepID=A0ABM1AAX5_APLCA|nr:uncharacterized protein LOC106013335 [Aplysia californica]